MPIDVLLIYSNGDFEQISKVVREGARSGALLNFGGREGNGNKGRRRRKNRKGNQNQRGVRRRTGRRRKNNTNSREYHDRR